MKVLQLFIPALFSVSVFSDEHMKYVKVILGDRFNISENCRADEEGELRREHPHRVVASHRRGVWTPLQAFKDRIAESSSVVFNRAVHTDSGVYVLKCGGRETDIQIEVVVSSQVSVRVGEAVSLPCYHPTTGHACYSVEWKKEDKVVLRRNSCDAQSTDDDRLSLSADWVSHGDLSLNLQPAHMEDQGDYFCYIQNQKSAVRLTVSERSPDQTSCAPSPLSVRITPTLKTCQDEGLSAVVTVAIAAVSLILGFFFGLFLKSHRSRCASCAPLCVRPGPGAGPDPDVALNPLNPPPPQQHVNGFQPSNDSPAQSAV